VVLYMFSLSGSLFPVMTSSPDDAPQPSTILVHIVVC